MQVWGCMIEGWFLENNWYYNLHIPIKYIFFLVSHIIRTSKLNMINLEQLLKEWSSKVFIKCVSDDKLRWKELCKFVGSINNTWRCGYANNV